MKLPVLTFAAAFLAGTAAFSAEKAPVHSQTTETFGAWTVRCTNVGADQTTRQCEALVRIQNKGNTIAEIAVGKGKQAGEAVVAGRTPLGVLISQPLQLQAKSDADAIDINYVTCLANGCVARTQVAAANLKPFTSEESGNLTLRESTGRTITISVPMNGFKDALSALGLV